MLFHVQMFMNLNRRKIREFSIFLFFRVCHDPRHITKNETIVIDTQHVLKLKTHKRITNDSSSININQFFSMSVDRARIQCWRRRAHHAHTVFEQVSMSFERFDDLMRQMESMRSRARPLAPTTARAGLSTTASTTSSTSRSVTRCTSWSALRQTLESHVDVVDRRRSQLGRLHAPNACRVASRQQEGRALGGDPAREPRACRARQACSRADGGVPEHFFAIDNDEHKLFVSVQRHRPRLRSSSRSTP
jgi:hypothetical protein